MDTSDTPATLPQKKHYRQRAHVNPIADHNFEYPLSPDAIDWSRFYVFDGEEQRKLSKVRYLDVGCGYGGLLVAMSPILGSNELGLGMEIRTKVSEYVHERIIALRMRNPGFYKNIWCLRTNAMRYIPNYVNKGQLTKMFFLFPDPHFKKQKHKWRIINEGLLAEYAYVCAIGAIVYLATDVKDLYDWMIKHFSEHRLFKQLNQEELDSDKTIAMIISTTEEGKKVERNRGEKFVSAFKRIEHREPHQTNREIYQSSR